MQSFDLRHFKTINTILLQDSRDTTCRYAFLRGGRGDPAEYQHLKQVNGDRFEFPLGLPAGKWLLYPFIESDIPRECGID